MSKSQEGQKDPAATFQAKGVERVAGQVIV
jgi:hypothetical protein